MADSEKLRYFALPSANIQTLRIRKMDSDPYFIDEKAEYISLDKPIEIKVLATCANRFKPTRRPFKEPVKRMLYWCIKKQNDYTVPKNVKFGKWDPVQVNLLPGLTTTVLSMFQERVMPDVEAIATNKIIERKRHPCMVNILKVSIGATIITKRILDLGRNLMVDKLLASAPVVEKQLTKAIFENKTVQF